MSTLLSALLPTHAMLATAAHRASSAPSAPSVDPSGLGVSASLREKNSVPSLQGVIHADGSVELLDRVSALQHRIIQFQLSRFPIQNVDAKLAHAQRELVELRAHPDDLTEWADVFILLLGAAACRGLTVNDLVDAAQVKMHINENRTWPSQPDAEGVYHHTSP